MDLIYQEMYVSMRICRQDQVTKIRNQVAERCKIRTQNKLNKRGAFKYTATLGTKSLNLCRYIRIYVTCNHISLWIFYNFNSIILIEIYFWFITLLKIFELLGIIILLKYFQIKITYCKISEICVNEFLSHLKSFFVRSMSRITNE